MRGGYVEIYRSLQDHWLWNHDIFTSGQAWIDLLLSAEYDDNKVEWKGKFIAAARGELITSQLKLARRWKWDRSRVNRFLKKLVGEKMISIYTDNDRTSGHTKIKILNYPPPRNEHSNRTQQPNTLQISSSNNTENQCSQELLLKNPEEFTIDLPELARSNWNKIASKSEFLPVYNRNISDQFADMILKCWKDTGLKPSEFIAEIHLLAQLAERDPWCSGRKPSKQHPNFKVTFRFLIRKIETVQDATDYLRQKKLNLKPAPTYKEVIAHEEALERQKHSHAADVHAITEALAESDRPEAKKIAAFLAAPFKSNDPRLPELERLKEKYINELRFVQTNTEEAQINVILKQIEATIKKIKEET